MSSNIVNAEIFELATPWECPIKGLRKEVIEHKFISMKKPTEISKCLVEITEIQNVNDRDTNFLTSNSLEFWIELSSAITPIDYYIELFIQQMFEGEKSHCYIKTKSNEEIIFILKLIKIDFNSYLFELSPQEMLDLAIKLKENGVKMFKKYPLFANEYFSRAAKCLISYKPFDVLNESTDEVNSIQMEELFQNLQINLSACLIKQNRFEDVLYLTQFIEDQTQPSEKAIYRRTLALYNLQKFDEAKELIEKYNCRNNNEFINLYNKIIIDSKKANERYKNVVKKMFG